MTKVLVSLTLCFSLFAQGCFFGSSAGTDNLVAGLEAIQAANLAASVAIPVAVAAGILPAQMGSVAMKIVSDSSTATTLAIAEAKSTTDTAAVVAEKIAGYYAVVLNDVPGLPPVVATVVQGILAAVQEFLNNMSGAVKSAKAVKFNNPLSKPLKLSGHDRSRLSKILESAQETQKKAETFRAAHK